MDRSIVYSDKVTVPGFGELNLVGKVFSDRAIGVCKGSAMVYLGGVRALSTDKDHLQRDYGRVLREVRSGTLKFNRPEGLAIPEAKFFGNLPGIGNRGREIFGLAGYEDVDFRAIGTDEPYHPIVAVKSGGGVDVDMGMKYTNYNWTVYTVVTTSDAQRDVKIAQAMNEALDWVGSHSFNAMKKVHGKNAWSVNVSLHTRLGPRETGNLLARVATSLVGCLESN